MARLILFIILGLGLTANCAAWAAKGNECLPPAQLQPEAALKLQAILRITGLVCQDAGGKPLYPTYQTFIQNNGPTLKTYQDQFEASYRQAGNHDPEKALHTRETELENLQSLAAAKAGVVKYCADHVPILQDAALASKPQLVRLVEALALTLRPANCPS